MSDQEDLDLIARHAKRWGGLGARVALRLGIAGLTAVTAVAKVALETLEEEQEAPTLEPEPPPHPDRGIADEVLASIQKDIYGS